jgi:cell cycle sensor histidine kinase DivJ
LSEFPAGILAGCDRLVHPEVEAVERDRQRRLVSVLLAAPFVAGPAFAISLSGAGSAFALSILCGAVALSWALVLLVALTGDRRPAERLALGAATLGLAISTAGGGLPVLALAAALAFESWWIARTRAGAISGIAAALAAFPLAALAGALLPGLLAASAGAGLLWLWLAPLAAGLAAFARMADTMPQAKSAPQKEGFGEESERLSLAMIRLNPAGDVVHVSAPAAAALGVPSDALLGRPLLERVQVADRVAFLSALADGGREARHVELRLRVASSARNGERFRHFAAEISVRADDVLVLLRDENTDGLRDELAEATARAESLDVAKSRFLAAVSHELRTPLNSIIGFSDMLLHGMAGRLDDPRQEEYVGLIRESGHHLLAVVNAVLDVSRMESGTYGIQPEPFSVREAVDLCHAMLTPQADAKGLNFLVRTRADVGEIVADRRAVQQIVINLAANAIKFTRPGGKVSVEAVRSGGWLRLVVSDTGIGMSAEDLGRVGKPFVQVQNDMTREYEGTGLGLSLVKGLVRLHEGEMSIESAPGEGTLVTVALPLAGPRGLAARGDDDNGGADEAVRKSA